MQDQKIMPLLVYITSNICIAIAAQDNGTQVASYAPQPSPAQHIAMSHGANVSTPAQPAQIQPRTLDLSPAHYVSLSQSPQSMTHTPDDSPRRQKYSRVPIYREWPGVHADTDTSEHEQDSDSQEHDRGHVAYSVCRAIGKECVGCCYLGCCVCTTCAACLIDPCCCCPPLGLAGAVMHFWRRFF